MNKILIADDNQQITSILANYARKEGFEPLVALDGQQALELFEQHEKNIDVVLLDVMMPKLDGFEVCRELRRRSMVPIIMVTARGEDFERIMGLDIGADDYILKPFSAGEVMARVRAILRRVQPREAEQQNLYSVGNLVIDLDKYLVTIGGADVTLTKKEVELLWTLAKNSSKVFSRENLLDSIWGYDYFGDSRTVDSHIKRLRAKVDKFEHEEWEIKTIWGVGYRFEEKELKKKEMQVRATKIAEVLQDNMSRLQNRYGGIGSSRFIRYIDNITMENVWVVDENKNVKMHREDVGALPEQHGMMHGHKRMLMRQQEDIAEPASDFDYNALSPEIKRAVEQGFTGQNFVMEEINPVLGELVVTVGVPVSDAGGKVRAVVLLHSPVQGMREAAWEGIRILILSCVVAMVLVFVLSMLFSWKFTKPLNKMRLVAEKMSEHDYTERCNIDQKDEIGQLAQTLDGLGERLLEADQASKKLEQLRRDFIANISHELRTPVTVIRGSLEALCDRIVTEPQEVEDYHRQMLAETLFLQRLINDLLDLSRLQNTDFPIEKEPVNLCDVVQDVVRSSQRLGQQKNITIQLSLDTPVYIIEGDYGRLRQMLLIFLDNSIKFSPEQSKIEVTLLGSRLTVTDHGCGVKQEELPHVFDRFYKTRGETNKSGSGLGLAISKQISERHGIGLTMTSIPGEATSVVLQLPPALKKGSTD